MEYRLVIDLAVLHFVLSRRPAERQLLIRTLEALARDPYRRGEFRERIANGRFAEVMRIGKFLITYWPDYAVKELRIARADML